MRAHAKILKSKQVVGVLQPEAHIAGSRRLPEVDFWRKWETAPSMAAEFDTGDRFNSTLAGTAGLGLLSCLTETVTG